MQEGKRPSKASRAWPRSKLTVCSLQFEVDRTYSYAATHMQLTTVVWCGGSSASGMELNWNPAVACTTLVRRFHIAFPPDSSRSMSAKYPKRIRVRNDAAR